VAVYRPRVCHAHVQTKLLEARYSTELITYFGTNSNLLTPPQVQPVCLYPVVLGPPSSSPARTPTTRRYKRHSLTTSLWRINSVYTFICMQGGISSAPRINKHQVHISRECRIILLCVVAYCEGAVALPWNSKQKALPVCCCYLYTCTLGTPSIDTML
jgi:hypothetical protein